MEELMTMYVLVGDWASMAHSNSCGEFKLMEWVVVLFSPFILVLIRPCVPWL